jgi:glycosyltransferase involved in cell wall biosynthesis
MNYGNCCLSSDIPENLEVIEGYGCTFTNRSQENLREKLSYLISRPDLVKSMKKLAQDYVRKTYSWDRVTDQMEELYRSVIGKIH